MKRQRQNRQFVIFRKQYEISFKILKIQFLYLNFGSVIMAQREISTKKEKIQQLLLSFQNTLFLKKLR